MVNGKAERLAYRIMRGQSVDTPRTETGNRHTLCAENDLRCRKGCLGHFVGSDLSLVVEISNAPIASAQFTKLLIVPSGTL